MLNGEITRADDAIANMTHVMSVLGKQLAQFEVQKGDVSLPTL